MMQSENIAALAEALAKAQGEFKVPSKNCEGKVSGISKTGAAYAYTYRYADLAAIIEATQAALSKYGLSVLQMPRIDGNAILLETRLMHSSGEWIASLYPVCSITGDHQKMGGALTYARRYARQSILGVAADDDLDGAHAEEAPTQKIAKAPAKPAERKAASASGAHTAPPKTETVTGTIAEPEGQPAAETLLAGFEQREGLRAIVGRIIQARKQIEGGFNPEKFPADYTLDVLDDAYEAWDAWRRAMWPALSAEEQGKLDKPIAVYTKEGKALAGLLRKLRRQAAVAESGADPDTGELPKYEAPQTEDAA